jgi:hypothetical protein
MVGGVRQLPEVGPLTTFPHDAPIPRAAPVTITTFPRSTIHPSVATCSYRHGVRLYFLQTQSGSQQTSHAAERYKIWSGRRWRLGQQSAPLPFNIPPDSLLRIARNTAGSNMAGYQ